MKSRKRCSSLDDVIQKSNAQTKVLQKILMELKTKDDEKSNLSLTNEKKHLNNSNNFQNN